MEGGFSIIEENLNLPEELILNDDNVNVLNQFEAFVSEETTHHVQVKKEFLDCDGYSEEMHTDPHQQNEEINDPTATQGDIFAMSNLDIVKKEVCDEENQPIEEEMSFMDNVVIKNEAIDIDHSHLDEALDELGENEEFTPHSTIDIKNEFDASEYSNGDLHLEQNELDFDEGNLRTAEEELDEGNMVANINEDDLGVKTNGPSELEIEGCPVKGNAVNSEELMEVGELLAPRKYQCTLCNKSYQLLKPFKRHLKWHQEPKKLPKESEKVLETKYDMHVCKCGKSYKRKSSVMACIKTHNTAGILCQWCSLIFKNPLELRKHCRVEHNEEYASRFQCSVCKKKCASNVLLDKHKKKLCTKKKLEETQGNSDDDVVIIICCNLCGKSFDTDVELKKHKCKAQPIVPPAKPKTIATHASKVAEARNLARQALMSHIGKTGGVASAEPTSEIRSSRNKTKSLSKPTPEILDLEVEEGQEEEDKKVKFQFTCWTCGLGCSTLRELADHKEMHNKKPKNKYTCNNCPDSFTTKVAFQIHHCKSAVPENTDCDVCQKTFPTEEQMLRHKATHPFVIFAKDDMTHKQIFFK